MFVTSQDSELPSGGSAIRKYSRLLSSNLE